MKTAYDIIRRPVITEQSMADTENKKYVFEVSKDATKIEIAKAVEEIFGVKVIKVNTLNVTGKLKRTGRYPAGRRPSWKKGCGHPVRRFQVHRVLRRNGLRRLMHYGY